ncbi:hypothetical protein C943_03757 [Mariniradius saccharolyticus AK6]|uniref:Uncharacterized protein n=1 Tax=Mariniradius saccharolyticus AK6 TaxID=1239962 RepID=M7Y1C6_9BACT|nr:hypothetical protein C943_03757 [Mariniradius saccharolyticus AK6]
MEASCLVGMVVSVLLQAITANRLGRINRFVIGLRFGGFG